MSELGLRTAAALAAGVALITPAAWPATRELPALVTHPTAASRAELLRVVRRALNGASVQIADDALTGDNVLLIERARHRDSEGRLLDGREKGRPERFRLVKAGSRCVLVHERTGRRWKLAKTTCFPR